MIGDIDLNGERIVCTVEAYTYDHELRDSFKMDGTPAQELFAYFTESEFEYEYEALGDLMLKPYIVVYFERYDLKGGKLSDVDPESCLRYEYRVFTDDELMQKFSDKQGYQTLGYPDGVYQKLVDLFAVRSASNGYFCSIATDYAPQAPVSADAKKGYEMHKVLTESEYLTDIDRTDVEKAYVLINYSGASDKSYYVYEDDYVEEFDSQSTTSLFKPKGTLAGIYQKALDMYISTLRSVTEDETAAGYKLNSLGIFGNGAQIPTVSDFSDIGCIFVEEFYATETVTGEIAYNLFLYFESCSMEKLEEKIAILEARVDVSEAAKISVKTYDNPAYD